MIIIDGIKQIIFLPVTICKVVLWLGKKVCVKISSNAQKVVDISLSVFKKKKYEKTPIEEKDEKNIKNEPEQILEEEKSLEQNDDAVKKELDASENKKEEVIPEEIQQKLNEEESNSVPIYDPNRDHEKAEIIKDPLMDSKEFIKVVKKEDYLSLWSRIFGNWK
jgi:hypothetical protein